MKTLNKPRNHFRGTLGTPGFQVLTGDRAGGSVLLRPSRAHVGKGHGSVHSTHLLTAAPRPLTRGAPCLRWSRKRPPSPPPHFTSDPEKTPRGPLWQSGRGATLTVPALARCHRAPRPGDPPRSRGRPDPAAPATSGRGKAPQGKGTKREDVRRRFPQGMRRARSKACGVPGPAARDAVARGTPAEPPPRLPKAGGRLCLEG